MTIEEAIRILDPEASKEALQPYAYDSCQMHKGVEEACRVAVVGLRKRQWISVKDRLPEVYRDEYGELIPFLVCIKDERYPLVLDQRYPFRAVYNGIFWYYGWAEVNVTHWMPLPDPPKE